MIPTLKEGMDLASRTARVQGAGRERPRRPGYVVLWFLPVVLMSWSLSPGWVSGAEPAAGSAKSLPALRNGTSEEVVYLRGVIQHSTRGRGRGGAVRLDVLSDAGEPTAVLTVPDSTLDTLGLSLRRGEEIEARGAMLPGKVPLLVVSEIVLEGRTIAIRESLDRGGRKGSGEGSVEGSQAGAVKGGGEEASPSPPASPASTPES